MRDLACGDLQRCVEIDDAVPLVVVRVPARSPLAKREGQLRSLQHLDGSLLIDAEHDGMLWWVEVEAHDVLHLRNEVRVTTDLVGSNEVRLEFVAAQDVGDAAGREADLLCEQTRGPPTATRWRRGHRQSHDALDRGGRHCVVLPPCLRHLIETPNPTFAEAGADTRDSFRRQVQPQRDLAA
jgi:hypothetical protein